jgi:hypothetical protein
VGSIPATLVILFNSPPLNFLRKKRNVKRFNNFKKTINFKKISRSYLSPAHKSKRFDEKNFSNFSQLTFTHQFRHHVSSHFRRLRIRLVQKILFSKKRQLNSYLNRNIKL